MQRKRTTPSDDLAQLFFLISFAVTVLFLFLNSQFTPQESTTLLQGMFFPALFLTWVAMALCQCGQYESSLDSYLAVSLPPLCNSTMRQQRQALHDLVSDLQLNSSLYGAWADLSITNLSVICGDQIYCVVDSSNHVIALTLWYPNGSLSHSFESLCFLIQVALERVIEIDSFAAEIDMSYTFQNMSMLLVNCPIRWPRLLDLHGWASRSYYPVSLHLSFDELWGQGDSRFCSEATQNLTISENFCEFDRLFDLEVSPSLPGHVVTLPDCPLHSGVVNSSLVLCLSVFNTGWTTMPPLIWKIAHRIYTISLLNFEWSNAEFNMTMFSAMFHFSLGFGCYGNNCHESCGIPVQGSVSFAGQLAPSMVFVSVSYVLVNNVPGLTLILNNSAISGLALVKIGASGDDLSSLQLARLVQVDFSCNSLDSLPLSLLIAPQLVRMEFGGCGLSKLSNQLKSLPARMSPIVYANFADSTLIVLDDWLQNNVLSLGVANCSLSEIVVSPSAVSAC